MGLPRGGISPFKKRERLCEMIVLVGKGNIPAAFRRHYPASKSNQWNVSELARVCDISRATTYKYIGLLEA